MSSSILLPKGPDPDLTTYNRDNYEFWYGFSGAGKYSLHITASTIAMVEYGDSLITYADPKGLFRSLMQDFESNAGFDDLSQMAASVMCRLTLHDIEISFPTFPFCTLWFVCNWFQYQFLSALLITIFWQIKYRRIHHNSEGLFDLPNSLMQVS